MKQKKRIKEGLVPAETVPLSPGHAGSSGAGTDVATLAGSSENSRESN